MDASVQSTPQRPGAATGERPTAHAQIERVSSVATETLCFDALYLPANRAGATRGWCDVAALDAGRYAFAIGEIPGDAGAAELMVAAFRAALGPGAAEAVAALSAGVPAAPPADAGMPDALIGILDARAATLSYSGAGQPPPWIRYRDGSVARLPAGLAAGLPPGGQPAANVVVDLCGAELVLFHGEALVAAAGGEADGARLVRRALEAVDRQAAIGPAAALAEALAGGRPHDDVALLSLALEPGAVPAAAEALPPDDAPRWSVSWSFDTTRVAATGVRRAFLACLESKERARPVDLGAAELIFGEMLGNVIRHAPGPVEITLDWTGELPLLHVLDDGPGFVSRRARERLPDDDWSESGRGLFIINACAAAFSVRNRIDGRGTHACATLPPA